MRCHATNNTKKVIARWWLQFDAIAWPDKLAMDLAAFLPDSGKPRQVNDFPTRSSLIVIQGPVMII